MGAVLCALVIYPIFVLVFGLAIWMMIALGLWIYCGFGSLELELMDAQVMGEKTPSQS